MTENYITLPDLFIEDFKISLPLLYANILSSALWSVLYYILIKYPDYRIVS